MWFFPSAALAITDGDLLVDNGRIGSVRGVLIVYVNIMNFVDDNCFSEQCLWESYHYLFECTFSFTCKYLTLILL